MKFGRLALILGTLSLGIVLVVSGIYMVVSGMNTRSDVKDGVTNERLVVQDPNVLLTYPGARAPEGVEVPEVLIDTGDEALAQSEVIRTHVLETTGGLTYGEMDRDDPNRDTYLTALTLQSALRQAHIGFEITRLVIGIGALVIVLGAGTIGLGVPLAYLVTNPKRERETSTEESGAARRLALEEA
jgi:hypothetical protein